MRPSYPPGIDQRNQNQTVINRIAIQAAKLAMSLVPLEVAMQAPTDRAALDSAILSLDEACAYLMAIGTGFSKPGCHCPTCNEKTFNPVIRETFESVIAGGLTHDGCSNCMKNETETLPII